jgi:hypothetical protein
VCGARYDASTNGSAGELNLPCDKCGGAIVRDWRAEGVGVGRGVRVSRDGTNKDLGELFLPGNDEFMSADDPDGTKGMRTWHDTHQPKEGAGDRALVPGYIDKRSF